MPKQPPFRQLTHKPEDGFPFVEEVWEDCQRQGGYRVDKAIEEGSQLPSTVTRDDVILHFMAAALMAVCDFTTSEEAAHALGGWMDTTFRIGKLEALLGAEKMQEVMEVLNE